MGAQNRFPACGAPVDDLRFTTHNDLIGVFLLLSHQTSGSRTRSEKEVSAFRVQFSGLGMSIGGSFCAWSRTFDSRLTCPVSAADTQTCRILHSSCMVAPLSSAVVYRRSYFVPFRRRWNGTELPFAARIILRYFAVRCGSKLRRAESSTPHRVADRANGISFFGWGLRPVVENGTSGPRSPQLE